MKDEHLLLDVPLIPKVTSYIDVYPVSKESVVSHSSSAGEIEEIFFTAKEDDE